MEHESETGDVPVPPTRRGRTSVILGVVGLITAPFGCIVILPPLHLLVRGGMGLSLARSVLRDADADGAQEPERRLAQIGQVLGFLNLAAAVLNCMALAAFFGPKLYRDLMH